MKRPLSPQMKSGLAAAGRVTLDVHGKNAYQARVAIDAALRRARGAYRIRVVHGYHSGTALREMIYEEYSSRAGVLRLESAGDGATELVLREL